MDERKLVIMVNDHAKMSRGKYAAQAVHAALLALDVHPDVPVIVLGGSPTEIAGMRTTVRDAGRTEVEPGTLTAGTDWVPSPKQAWLGLLGGVVIGAITGVLLGLTFGAVDGFAKIYGWW